MSKIYIDDFFGQLEFVICDELYAIDGVYELDGVLYFSFEKYGYVH